MSRRSFTNQAFKKAAKSSISIAEILRKIGLQPRGSNYDTVKNLAKELDIDLSHLLGNAHLRGQIRNLKPKIPTNELLVKGIFRGSHGIKKRILKEDLLENICCLCGLSDWMNMPISLHLDHINGDGSDNRLENLRLLCPNCHSQTETYAGKKNKGLVQYCVDCGIKTYKHSKRCRSCLGKQRLNTNTKIEWPDTKELLKMIQTTSYVALGKKLGVSDNAIRNRIKKHPV